MRWDIFQWNVFSHQISQFALKCLLACLIPPKQNTLFIFDTFDINIVLLKMAGDYLKNPNTVHEKFINKEWVERKDIMQSKKSYIIEVNKEWNGLDEEQ